MLHLKKQSAKHCNISLCDNKVSSILEWSTKTNITKEHLETILQSEPWWLPNNFVP